MNILNRKDNNFDIMRLVAAWMVLYSHAFALYDDSLDVFVTSINYSPCSGIALHIFFVISGYLITQSYLYRKNIKIFTVSRLLRLLPALIVVVLLSTFVIGAIVTTKNLQEYFTDIDTYKYLNCILIFPLKYTLPGVFENNPYRGAVNGSLWTLGIELKCYIFIGVLGFFSILRANIIFIITTFCFVINILLNIFPEYPKYILTFKYSALLNDGPLFLAFFSGASLYFLKDKISYTPKLFFIILVSDIIAWYYIPFGEYIHTLLISYLIIYIALHLKPAVKFLHGTDISYGVYIYAFPIQQTYMHYLGQAYGFTSFVLTTTLVTFILGYISWKLVEKPSLDLKKQLSN
ncbi:MAG: acyltransferase [Alphaproteobacteria bacterium]|nr:acyltransferase [Alphaproteobacteria bacterium]